jgi:Domain of unknown function (DUF4184)
MPMTFPAHQGLILPVMRRWPHSFDALALSVGAAMPDITDTILSFPLNGYFRQWYGHSLVGVFTLDLVLGLLITWLIAMFARRLFRNGGVPQRLQPLITEPLSSDEPQRTGGGNRVPLHLWSFSVFIGILSHIGFDLISHDTNLLLYPWVENPRWYPDWWYTIWFKLRPLSMFGRAYAVGVFSIIWGLLTLIGTVLFIRFLSPKREDRI